MTIRTGEVADGEAPTNPSQAMNREALRTLLFRHREALLVLLSVPVIASALRGGGIPRTSALIGTAVVAAGVLLRLCAVRRIGRGARVFHAHARAGLVCSGPYRWTRNPLYLAAGLMLCGFGLIAGAGWTAVALLPATLLAYTPVVITEERALIGLFGDTYQRYLAAVPRWIGATRADRGASCAQRAAGERRPSGEGDPLIDWREVFRREKRLVPGTLLAILAIAATRGEWLPLAWLARRIQLATGLDLVVLIASAAAIAVVVNAIKVELHQQRRRAARSAVRRHAADR